MKSSTPVAESIVKAAASAPPEIVNVRPFPSALASSAACTLVTRVVLSATSTAAVAPPPLEMITGSDGSDVCSSNAPASATPPLSMPVWSNSRALPVASVSRSSGASATSSAELAPEASRAMVCTGPPLSAKTPDRTELSAALASTSANVLEASALIMPSLASVSEPDPTRLTPEASVLSLKRSSESESRLTLPTMIELVSKAVSYPVPPPYPGPVTAVVKVA